MKAATKTVPRWVRYALLGATGLALLGAGGVYVTTNQTTPTAPMPSRDERLQAMFAAPRPVRLATVVREDARATRTFPGCVRASREAELAFRVGGPLACVAVQPGAVVTQGQVLLEIDPRDFTDTIRTLNARRDGALTGGEIARLMFDRVAPLFTQQVVSLTEYDKARSSLAAAQANVADLEAQLQVARHQLVDTILRAPFAGVVTRVDVDAREMVKAGTVVLHLHDISLLELDVDVAEREMLVHRLATNELAAAVFSSIPDRVFPVQLVEWSTASDAQTRTYRVTFALHAPDDVTILPGMSAEVAWPGSHGTGITLAIPPSAVTADSGGTPCVWVYDAATATVHRRVVQLGVLTKTGRTVVLVGLLDGERIVAAGTDALVEDMRVTPLDTAE